MNPSTRAHRLHDNRAVGPDTASTHLAAIQYGYEEAKAGIIEPANFISDDLGAFPGTEKIDVPTVGLPAVPAGASGTEAMTVAARRLAEQFAAEEPGFQPSGTEPRPASPGRRSWWRGVRRALQGVVPPPGPQA